MNIKQYEEEVKKGCGKTFDIDDPNYITFCGVTCHTQHPDDLGLGVDLCQECRGKWEAIQKCKEMFKEREENLKQLIKSDILLFEQVSKCLDCEGCKKIIKLRIEELLSQLNGEEQ